MKVSITSVNNETNGGKLITNYYFDNDVWVGITPSDKTWELQHDDDEESYISGKFVTIENVVVGFDGCNELPKEVEKALRHQGYKMVI